MGDDAFMTIFWLMFFGIFAVWIFIAGKGIAQWSKNNHSPKLTVPAKIVTKRNHVHHSQHSASRTYYVTFEFESGDRLELHLSGSEYGLLAEGDTGMLTFQGTRYLSFERNR